jgi:hypothetical protein
MLDRWVWTEGHQECFEQLKESLKENALLNYYDPSLPTEVASDASPVGVLYNNPRRPRPFRVERMRLKLQGFSFNVVYHAGKFNPSDYTSRQRLPMAHSTKTDQWPRQKS